MTLELGIFAANRGFGACYLVNCSLHKKLLLILLLILLILIIILLFINISQCYYYQHCDTKLKIIK